MSSCARGNVFLYPRECLPAPEGMSSCTRGSSSAPVSFKCSLTSLESSNSASFARPDVDAHVHHRIRNYSQYRQRDRDTHTQRLILWSLFHRQTELVFSCFCPFNLEQSFNCHLVWLSASRPIRPSEEDADDHLLSLKWQTSLSPTALKPELDSQKCGVSVQWATQNDQD